MKKILLIVLCVVVVLAAGLVLYNYFYLPEHVRGQEDAETSSALDSRVQEVLEFDQKSLMEEKGIDLSLSKDLLQMMNQYWQTELVDMGVGLYQGSVNDHLTIEMLLNEDGNVGQVQLRFNPEASEQEKTEGLIQYIRFLNKETDEETAKTAAKEAQVQMDALVDDADTIFYKYDVGFGMRRESESLFVYIP